MPVSALTRTLSQVLTKELRLRAPVDAAWRRLRSGERLLVRVWRSDPRRANELVAALVSLAAAQAGLMISSGAVVQSLVDGRVGTAAVGPLAVFGVVLLATALLAWSRTVLTARLSGSYAATVETDLAQLSLAPSEIGHLESSRLRPRIESAIDSVHEGVHRRVVPALVDLWGTRLSGVASAVVLAGFRWWAPVVMLGGYLLLIRGYRRWLRTVFDDLADLSGQARRRSEYYRSLMGDPAAAKEVRLFGLAPWLDDRFAQIWTTAMQTVWANRARSTRPVLVGGLALLVAWAAVAGTLGWQAASGLVPVGAILVYIQAIAGMDALSYQGESAWHLSRGQLEIKTLEALQEDVAGQTAGSGPDPEQHQQAGAATAAVSITNLSFCYPGQRRRCCMG